MYIEASAIDNKVWGEGWQWDDDMNILMPRFGSYNLDKKGFYILFEREKDFLPASSSLSYSRISA